MERIVKRYFWVLHVGLIVLGALLSALTVNNFLSAGLAPLMVTAPPPPAAAPKTSGSSARGPRLGALSSTAWTKKETAEVEGTAEVEEPEEEVPATVEGEYPLSDLKMRLVGTMVAEDPSFSLAMLDDKDANSTYSLSEGETIGEDGKLVKIERDRIVIQREGNLEQIDLENDEGSGRGGKFFSRNKGSKKKTPSSRAPFSKGASKVSKTPAKSSGAKSALAKNIKKISDSEYQVDKKTLQDVFKDPAKFRKGANAKPNMKGGRLDGFRLTGIRPGTPLHDIGLRSSDVIKSVNGKKLNNANVALELYGKMQGGGMNGLNLVVERGGKSKKLNYSVK